MRPVLAACLLCLPWLAAAWPGEVRAQEVRRCIDVNGVSVYTDRACSELDAVARVGPGAPAALEEAGGFAIRGCARSPQALLGGVRHALEARDVNQLANYYHWPGTSRSEALRLMTALEAIAQRPLVAIDLVYPEAPESAPGEAAAEPLPEAMALQQMRGDDDIHAETTAFRLERQAGCWWFRY